MKCLRFCLLLTGVLLFIVSFSSAQNRNVLNGAWSMKTGSVENIAIFQDGYCSFSSYDIESKKFINTKGGAYLLKDNILTVTLDFNAEEGKDVGKKISSKVSVSSGKLIAFFNGTKQEWVQIDRGDINLSGCWRINGRMQGDQMHPMEDAPRKTLKILSSTRFQWFAINTATGDFFGTGGGTYTYDNENYVEQIAFFSRDSSRVGKQLSFKVSIEDNIWHHSGFGSNGNPIKETWIRYIPQ